MPEIRTRKYASITQTDIELAAAYFSVLIDSAASRNTLTYGELVGRVKSKNHGLPVAQKAIAVTTGRRLNIIRLFSEKYGLPDISTIVVNKRSGRCSKKTDSDVEYDLEIKAVFEKSWSFEEAKFARFLKELLTSTVARKKVTEDIALKLMSEYYMRNKKNLPDAVRSHRSLIVEMIMNGATPQEAFARAIIAT